MVEFADTRRIAQIPVQMPTRDPWIRALVITMLLIGAVYLTGLIWQIAAQVADIILLFLLAWVISFVLEPLVAALHSRAGLPRQLAVFIAYLAVLVVVSLGIVQVVPRLSAQVIQVANDLPFYADWANTELLRLQALLASQGINIAAESLLSYQELVRHVETLGPQVLTNTVGIATGVANLLLQVFIILILSYYITLDGQRISGALVVALPRAYRGDALYFIESVNRAFAGFMRGQLAQAVIYGFGTAAVLSAVGVKLVLLTSVAAGFFMLLPFVGPVLAIGLPLLITAVGKPDAFWAVLLTLFVLQQIVVNVLAPRLMSQTVGLHPLLVFAAVLGGAKVAGVWGAVFGIPIVAVAAAMASFYRVAVEQRRDHADLASDELTEATQKKMTSTPPTVSPPFLRRTEAESLVGVGAASAPPPPAEVRPHSTPKEAPLL
jgi:predicted PurR-regulated permease PerM